MTTADCRPDRKWLTSRDGGYAVVMPGALAALHLLHTTHMDVGSAIYAGRD